MTVTINQRTEVEIDIPSWRQYKHAAEIDYARRVLTATRGNMTSGAKVARMDRKAFYELVRRAGVNPREYRLAR